MHWVILGVILIFLIGFFVLLWKTAPNWYWYQILPVALTMILSIVFWFPTAGVLRSRNAWHEVKERLEARAEKVQEEFKRLKFGDGQTSEGVARLKTQLIKLGVESGRSWRSLQYQGVNGNVVTLSGQPAAAAPVPAQGGDGDGNGGDGAAAAVNRGLIPEGLVVYGFVEATNQAVDPNGQLAVPTIYLGEFVVTSSTADQVSMQPTSALADAQVQIIQSGQARTWTIYELLPLDDHGPFIALGSSPGDDNALGRVDEELVRALLGDKVSEETLRTYLEDGRRANENDSDDTVWTRIEFLETYSVVVDSDDQRGALDGTFFDGTGRAVDARLQRTEGDSVTFKKGDTLLMLKKASRQLIADGTAKLLDEYYLRPLNDYRFILRHIRLRLTQLASISQELNVQKSQLSDAIDRSNTMLVANNDIKLRLEQDLAQHTTEKNAITQYAQQLQTKVTQTRQTMGRLHKQNVALAQRLAQLQLGVENANGLRGVENANGLRGVENAGIFVPKAVRTVANFEN